MGRFIHNCSPPFVQKPPLTLIWGDMLKLPVFAMRFALTSTSARTDYELAQIKTSQGPPQPPGPPRCGETLLLRIVDLSDLRLGFEGLDRTVCPL